MRSLLPLGACRRPMGVRGPHPPLRPRPPRGPGRPPRSSGSRPRPCPARPDSRGGAERRVRLPAYMTPSRPTGSKTRRTRRVTVDRRATEVCGERSRPSLPVPRGPAHVWPGAAALCHGPPRLSLWPRGGTPAGDEQPCAAAAHARAAAGRPSREPRPGRPASSRLVRRVLCLASHECGQPGSTVPASVATVGAVAVPGDGRSGQPPPGARWYGGHARSTRHWRGRAASASAPQEPLWGQRPFWAGEADKALLRPVVARTNAPCSAHEPLCGWWWAHLLEAGRGAPRIRISSAAGTTARCRPAPEAACCGSARPSRG
ncbi:hypothetical protein SCANM63S_07206 [Streptomyces canarius]